jgi:hypothetical protein
LNQAIFQFMFDVGKHFAVVIAILDVKYDKAVQRVAVGGRVNLGIDDAVAGTGEEADDAGKQIRLVLRVDHDLQAFAFLMQAGADDRLVIEYPVMQRTRVPGDFLSRVAQEIDGIELLPEALMHRVGEREEAQQAHGLGLALGDDAVRGGGSPWLRWCSVW